MFHSFVTTRYVTFFDLLIFIARAFFFRVLRFTVVDGNITTRNRYICSITKERYDYNTLYICGK